MTRTPVRLTARSRQATRRLALTSRTRWNWGARGPALGHALDHDPPDGARRAARRPSRRGDAGRGEPRAGARPRRGRRPSGRRRRARSRGGRPRRGRARPPAAAPSATPARGASRPVAPGCAAVRRSTKASTSAFSIRAAGRASPGRGRRRAARRPSAPGEIRRPRPRRATRRRDRRRPVRGAARRRRRPLGAAGCDGSAGLVGPEDERDRLADRDHVACLRGHLAAGRRSSAPRSRRWPCRSRSRGAGRPSAPCRRAPGATAGPCRSPAPARVPA